MFCDRCGTQVQENQAFCPSCGKSTQAPMPLMPVQSRIAGHIRLLGIFWLAYSALNLLGGWFMASIFPRFFEGTGFGTPFPFFVTRLVHGLGVILAVKGVLGIVAGWGLLERQSWARTLAIVLGCFALIHFALGTALGVYTLWVLLPSESEREYRRLARVA